MSIRLPENERNVLSLLHESSDLLLPEQIAERLKITLETVLSLVESLYQKGLITRKAAVVERLVLTPEGQKYAEKGLPEVRLVTILKEGGGKGCLEELLNSFSFNLLVSFFIMSLFSNSIFRPPKNPFSIEFLISLCLYDILKTKFLYKEV